MSDEFDALGPFSLRQIRAFIAVAKAGNFTAASRSLNLSQSAVSILVAELERALSLKLFDRTSRSVELTEAGREFLEPATRALLDLQGAIVNSRELSRKNRGKVHVAASPLFSSLILPRFLRAFRADYPSIDVTVQDLSAPMLRSAALRGDADLVIGTPSRTDDSSDDVTIDVFHLDEVVLVCKPDHPLASLEIVRWQDLIGLPYIAVKYESGTREIVEEAMARAGVSLAPAFEVSSVWTLLGMVTAGMGFSLTTGNARLLKPLYDVAIRRINGERIERPIGFMRHRRRSLTPAASAFAIALTQWMAQEGAQPEEA